MFREMRALFFVALLLAGPLCAQENCDVFNLQGLVASNAAQQAQIDSLSCLAGVEMDGYRYKGVVIGDQCWFAENLRTTVYADGSAIPEVTGNGAWSGLSTGARCFYNNDGSSPHGYGPLYNWYAVDNASGLCPSGWHVPTDEEWNALETYVSSQGFSGTEGTALRATLGWTSNGNGTDDFVFSALPGGYRSTNGAFFNAGVVGYWWSSTPDGGDAFFRDLYSLNTVISRYFSSHRSGVSIRCLRDAD